MKLLLTGSTGMLGRNLLDALKTKKYDVLSPSRDVLDLLDFNKINIYLKDNKPDIIIHAAGCVGGIKANQNNQLMFFFENTLMGMNLVKAAYSHKILNFLNIASSCIYPSNFLTPIKEDNLLDGKLEPTNEGYALAKISILKMCEFISNKNSNFNYKTIIPCNLFGKYDTFEIESSHLLPAIILKIHNAILNSHNKVEIWGDGKVKREFMYAEDCADALIHFIGIIDKIPQNMNIGVNSDYSIYDYYKKVSDLLGYKGKFTFNQNMPNGITRKKK